MNGEMMEYMVGRRGIPMDVLTRMKIEERLEFLPQTGKEEACICFPYLEDGVMKNMKFRDAAKHFKMVKGAELIPWNIDAIKGKEKCYITEGEIDALSLIAAGLEEVVSVPNGAGGANLQWLDRFVESHFDDKAEIILAMDTDRRGVELRDELVAPPGRGSLQGGGLGRRLQGCQRVSVEVRSSEAPPAGGAGGGNPVGRSLLPHGRMGYADGYLLQRNAGRSRYGTGESGPADQVRAWFCAHGHRRSRQRKKRVCGRNCHAPAPAPRLEGGLFQPGEYPAGLSLPQAVTRNFAASLFRNIKYFTLRKLYLCRKWMQKRLQKTTTTGITLPNFDFLA